MRTENIGLGRISTIGAVLYNALSVEVLRDLKQNNDTYNMLL